MCKVCGGSSLSRVSMGCCMFFSVCVNGEWRWVIGRKIGCVYRYGFLGWWVV